MSTSVNASEPEQANLLAHEPTEDEIDEDPRETISAANDDRRQASASLVYLLILTCGVAG